MELNQIKLLFNLSNRIENLLNKDFQYLINLTNEFKEIFDVELSKLPYHMNVIDELHADENAHSRIFAKLLRYQENNKYPFLENFLRVVCNFDLSIENPEVKKVDSCGRIDIPIFDNKYIVLIENKVTDKAPDQNNLNGGQLARYIEAINNSYGRKIEEIYVVYTPKFTRQPSDDSWKNNQNYSYKNDFVNRFCSVSYFEGIYPWIKYWVLPSLDKKHNFLYSAIEQYIDYLEGIFSLRLINKPMNMKIHEFLKTELGIQDENFERAIEILNEKQGDLNNLLSQIQQLKSIYEKKFIENNFLNFKKLLELDFLNMEIVGDSFKLNKRIINLGIKFVIDNKPFVAMLECEYSERPNFYFGVGRHFVTNERIEMPESLQKILQGNNFSKPENFWYGWKSTTIENAYLDLKNLITQISLYK